MDSNYFSENVKKEIYQKNSKKTVSIPTLIISILTTIVFILIIVSKWADILSFVGVDMDSQNQNIVEDFYVGDEISMTGTIYNNGDILNYTHTINSLEFGILGLNSLKVNLNNYHDEVYVEGIVERIHQGTPVILVSTIYSLDIDDDIDVDLLQDDIELESKYFSNIGIYLDSDFFAKYSLLNQGEGGTLKLKNRLTDKITNITYFKCNKSSNDQNCDRFNDMFSQSSEQKFVDSYSVTYYKQPDIKSWFFSNGSLFGYFVNNVENDELKELAKYLKIVNQKFVEKNILDDVGNLCLKDGKKLINIKNKSLYIKSNDIYYFVEGTDKDSVNMTCELKIDPILKSMVSSVVVEIDLNLDDKTDIIDDSDKNLQNNDLFDWSVDVKQFPLNLERSLQFTSRKGFTYIFPSSNIAYASQSAQENFDQVGVNCYSVMNVVQYSEKDLVNQKGNVKIYECSIKSSFDDSDKKLTYKPFGEKHFVIEIVDPAWIDFAKNVQIIVD